MPPPAASSAAAAVPRRPQATTTLTAGARMADPQILEYEDEILHRSDLDSLGDGCWLTDPVISFYFAFMHKELFGSAAAIQPLAPSVVFLIVHSDPASALEIVAPLALPEVRDPARVPEQPATPPLGDVTLCAVAARGSSS